eukprot:CAMPEP_0201141858 /NCGR_PEP_ID=MMETSP0851-20130426/3549_1 /ASSEMBLY_ACC=CAM_ASM_000631 /TAXON_ID=183588 /ORGANISM="Pseudo-nitzschia fraudulenta, Strain WWA7" /LENGTH=153 /DNA_ID=CAMNT_0047415227 /DNA_START=75 /DNA_END=536 /DNA_ORIENTATION=+
MTKKKSATGHRRKKSNTTTQNEGAKRSKTVANASAEYRNGILHGLRVILGKMDDKELLAVMGYVSTMDEKQKLSTLQPSMTVTATATEEATATATATVNSQAAPTDAANPTTEEVNLPETTTTVPPSPQDPAVIELNKKTRPSPHNLVTLLSL